MQRKCQSLMPSRCVTQRHLQNVYLTTVLNNCTLHFLYQTFASFTVKFCGQRSVQLSSCMFIILEGHLRDVHGATACPAIAEKLKYR